jgi:hypothetical protein
MSAEAFLFADSTWPTCGPQKPCSDQEMPEGAAPRRKIVYGAYVHPSLKAYEEVAMLTDDVLQRMYELAYCLNPDNGIALSVTLEACDRIALLRRMQDRRGGHYRFRLPEACLPQYCVYLASDAREREQERWRPGREPRYRPTADDYLVRYLKFIVAWTMDRNACHVAVALGCFLYGYQPGDIANLAPEIFNHHNIRRVKRRLSLQLQDRFQSANIVIDAHHTLCTRAPTAHERQLVDHALALLTPWGAPHISAPAPDRSLLETHFDGGSTRSEWERIHALVDPACAGLPRLVREYNASFPGESCVRLEDPDHMLAIPCFDP